MGIEIGTSKVKVLLQEKTNLKSLRYRDQAPYGEPYIQKDIEKKSKELPDKWYKKYAQTGLTLVERRTDDVVRIAKFIGSPKGLLWESRQLGLQSMQNFFDQGRQHKFEQIHEEQKKTGKFVDALIAGGKAILQGIGMTASTLTQVGLSGTGYHGHTFLTRAYLRKDGTVLGTILAGIGIGNGGDYLDGSSHAKGGSLVPVTADSLSNKRQLVLSGSTETKGEVDKDFIPANRDANPSIHFSAEEQQKHSPRKSLGISAPDDTKPELGEPATYVDPVSVQKQWHYSESEPSQVKAYRSYDSEDVNTNSRYNKYGEYNLRDTLEVPSITKPEGEITYINSASVQKRWYGSEPDPSRVKANMSYESKDVNSTSRYNNEDEEVTNPQPGASVKTREEKGNYIQGESDLNFSYRGKEDRFISNADEKSTLSASFEESPYTRGKKAIVVEETIAKDIYPSWFTKTKQSENYGNFTLSDMYDYGATSPDGGVVYAKDTLEGDSAESFVWKSAFGLNDVSASKAKRKGYGYDNIGQTVTARNQSTNRGKVDIVTRVLHKGSAQSCVSSSTLTLEEKEIRDDMGLIPFTISKITPDKRTYLNFAANLNSYSDKYTGNWDSIQYIGRAENFYGYTGFAREIEVSFTVVAMHAGDLREMYVALNQLAGATAPSYAEEGLFMRGTLSSLTIGDLLKDKVGIIKSVSLTWKEDYVWEVGNGGGQYRVPHALDVSISFTPIEEGNVREDWEAYFVFTNEGQNSKEAVEEEVEEVPEEELVPPRLYEPPAEPKPMAEKVDTTSVSTNLDSEKFGSNGGASRGDVLRREADREAAYLSRLPGAAIRPVLD